jgi:tetratricopeptide (TPR) repeat protein/transcriptional regulator with XRE-family HTH domain
MPDHRRLAILIRLRKAARVTLAQMARACGLEGSRAYESVSAWERGEAVPRAAVRTAFLGYLAHTLNLADDRETLAAVWETLVHEWGWEPLQPADWRMLDSGQLLVGATPGRYQLTRSDPTNTGAPLPAHLSPAPVPLPPGSRVPFAPNPHFVGRAAELLTIAGHLHRRTAPIHIAVSGPGGIGKTQLAIEIVHRCGHAFPGGVFWLGCADPAAVPAAIAACGGQDGLRLRPDFDRLSLDEQVRLVLAAWQEETPRLLVFDSCEDPALLRRWLPRRGGCRALITSQRRTWDADLPVATLPLGLLSRAESLALLRRYCPTPQISDADLIAIAAELDDLPLALHLAGSHLARGADTLTPTCYLAELRARLDQHPSLAGVDPRGRPLPAPTGHHNRLEQVVALSLSRLDPGGVIDALACQLLLRAAWFAPGEPIPGALLSATLAPRPDPALLAGALQRLVDIGMVLDGAGAYSGRLHRLIAAFLRRLDNDGAAQHAVETALLAHARLLNAALDQPALLRIQAHLRAVTDAALVRGDAIAADLSYELSRHLGEIDQYASAIAYNQRSLDLRNQIFGADSVASSANLHFHGMMLDWLGDYPGARPYHERALAIRHAQLGPDHPDTATSTLHAGEIAHAVCDYAQARTYYEQALAARIRHDGPDSPGAAELYNNLGLLLNAMGKFDAALPYAERAVAIWEAQEQPNRSLQSMAINNLGYLHRARGEYAAALVQLRRALAIREEVYGPMHSFVGVTRNHIGRVYHYQGRFEQAGAELEATLRLFDAAIGREHPITACALSNLGMLALEMGDHAGARWMLEAALDIHRQILGAAHRHTARELNRLGLLHQAFGDRAMATRYLRAALAVRRRILGDLHHDTANTLGHLGVLLLSAGRPRQARPLLAAALRRHLARLGERHPYTARSLLRMGQVCAALGEREISRDYLSRALAVYTAVLGADHPYTLAARQAQDTAC